MRNRQRLLRLGLALFMFMLAIVTSYSQFLNKDATWTVGVSHWGDGFEIYYYDAKVGRDTLINDKVYSIFKDRGWLFALREDSNKVYYKNIEDYYLPGLFDSMEHKLYDFDLRVNDTIHLFLPMNNDYKSKDWVVENVDTILINNEQKKRIKLKMIPYGYPEQYWIEDIGSTFGPLYITGITEFEQGFELYCYKINGEKLYGECLTSNSSIIQAEKKDILLLDTKLSRIKIKLPTKDWCTLNVYTLTGNKTMQLMIPCNQFVHLDNINQGFYIFEVIAPGIRHCKKVIIN